MTRQLSPSLDLPPEAVSRLRPAENLTLPVDAVAQTFLIVGKRGSGKRSTAERAEYLRQWRQAHALQQSEYYKRWRAANPERDRAYHAVYYRKNKHKWQGLRSSPERRRQRWARRSAEINARRRARRVAEPVRFREIERAYRQRTAEKKRERDRAWRRQNMDKCATAVAHARAAKPELYRAIGVRRTQRRRARVAGNVIELVGVDRIRARDKGICHLCDQLVEASEFSLDHLIPVCRRGAWAEWNLAVAHRSCNCRRRDARLLTEETPEGARAYLEARR